MKKVAIVTTLSGFGGTEKSLLSLLKVFPENVCDLTLLLMGERGELVDEVPKWVKIRYINQLSGGEYIRYGIREKSLYRAVDGVFRSLRLKYNWKKYKTDTMRQYHLAMYLFERIDEQYDLAITWFVPNSYHTVYTLEKVNANRKVMWIHMDVKMDRMPFDSQDYFLRYNKIFCVSKACRDSFVEMYPDCKNKVEICYNVLDIDEIKRLAGQECPMMNDAKSFKIVTCGRIAEEKQPLYAVHIMKKLREEGYRDVKWYFIGDGVLRPHMEQAIEHYGLEASIVLCGIQKNPYPYVKNADLYVQMSKHESFCLTLAEAQCLAVPAITTNFKAAYEIVNDKKTGYIVDDCWEAIYDGIKKVLDDQAEYTRLKNNLDTYSLKANGSASNIVTYINS